jgi:hypothetical protein
LYEYKWWAMEVVSFSYSFTSGSITAGSWAEAMLISSSGPTNDKKSVSSFPASSTNTVAGASITFTLRLNANETVIPKIWHNLGDTRELRVGTFANDGFVNFSVAEL